MNGWFCPAGHGPLLLMANDRLYCPDAEHDGRPASHPLGAAPRTPAWFDDFVSVSPASGRVPPSPATRRRSKRGR